jgi:hypothetical protein
MGGSRRVVRMLENMLVQVQATGHESWSQVGLS